MGNINIGRLRDARTKNKRRVREMADWRILMVHRVEGNEKQHAVYPFWSRGDAKIHNTSPNHMLHRYIKVFTGSFSARCLTMLDMGKHWPATTTLERFPKIFGAR
jgi:hypothetical protein